MTKVLIKPVPSQGYQFSVGVSGNGTLSLKSSTEPAVWCCRGYTFATGSSVCKKGLQHPESGYYISAASRSDPEIRIAEFSQRDLESGAEPDAVTFKSKAVYFDDSVLVWQVKGGRFVEGAVVYLSDYNELKGNQAFELKVL